MKLEFQVLQLKLINAESFSKRMFSNKKELWMANSFSIYYDDPFERNLVYKNPRNQITRFWKRVNPYLRIKKTSEYLDDPMSDEVGWRKSGSVTSS